MESPISTRAVILQALCAEPSYGLAIMTRTTEATDGGLVIQSGSLYPALVSLEKEGLIVKKKKVDSGRACFYELTRKGRQLAREHRFIALRVFFPWQDKDKKWLDGFASNQAA